jgi:dTDP-4-dehydrorhamnose reductase
MFNGKKIYIAGAGGMLGEAFHEVFSQTNTLKCTDLDVNENWIEYLDFRNTEEYFKDVANFQPDVLFHIGALTSLEYCEENPKNAYLTNTLAAETATHISNELEIPILYISTAGIFDGKQDQYDDWDEPNPLGVYARSKYLGEKYVSMNNNKHLICRAGWMMGGGPNKDKKFIQKIMKQIKNGKKELFIVNDKLGTPTYTKDFALNVSYLLNKKFWGIYNMVCNGVTSRLEVARELVKNLNLEDQITITSVNSDYFAEEYFAERPASERLITKKLDLRNSNKMRDWKICLKEYLEKYYKSYL